MVKHEYILLNFDSSDYTYYFPPNNPLVLHGDAPEIGLKSLFMWYTFPNIAPEYENDTFKLYKAGIGWKTIQIPKGMYELEDIGHVINTEALKMEPGNEEELWNPRDKRRRVIRVTVNTSTFKVVVKLSSSFKLDFSEGKLYELLGLEPKVYDKPYEQGKNIVNITRGVDRILLRCDLVDRKYQKDLNNVLYDILPYAQPGEALQERLDEVEYFECKDKTIRSIHIRLTDTKNNLIYLSEPVSIKIAFKYGKDSKIY